MKEFKGSLGQYRIIKTEDESETIWSEYFDENCHNISGAKDETIYNYINGCEIQEMLKRFSPLNIFDVGFGLGMGLTLLLETISDQNHFQINYYSIELDEVFLEWTLNEKFKSILFKTIELNGLKFKEAQYKNFKIIILIGDARLTVPLAIKESLFSPLHAIFQDPFSPKKTRPFGPLNGLKFSRDYPTQMSFYRPIVHQLVSEKH